MELSRELKEKLERFGDRRDYPMLFYENTPQRFLNDLTHGGFTKLTIVEIFDDDHEECVNVIVVANGHEYRFSKWWIDKNIVDLFCYAETSQPHRDELLIYLLESNEDNQDCREFLNNMPRR